jgi:hypothetical protein
VHRSHLISIFNKRMPNNQKPTRPLIASRSASRLLSPSRPYGLADQRDRVFSFHSIPKKISTVEHAKPSLHGTGVGKQHMAGKEPLVGGGRRRHCRVRS